MKARKILVISWGLEKCIFNQKYHDEYQAHLMTPDYNSVTTANKDNLDSIKDNMDGFDVVIGMTFSERQSKKFDEFLSEIWGTETSSSALDKLCQELKIQPDYFRLQVIYGEEVCKNTYRDYSDFPVLMDCDMAILMYAQMHYLANKFPHDEITYRIYNAHKHTLEKLTKFYKHDNPEYIPHNFIAIDLNQYDGTINKEYSTFKGQQEGMIDEAYCETVKQMNPGQKSFFVDEFVEIRKPQITTRRAFVQTDETLMLTPLNPIPSRPSSFLFVGGAQPVHAKRASERYHKRDLIATYLLNLHTQYQEQLNSADGRLRVIHRHRQCKTNFNLGLNKNTGRPYINDECYRAGIDKNDKIFLAKKEQGKWIRLTKANEIDAALNSNGLFGQIIETEITNKMSTIGTHLRNLIKEHQIESRWIQPKKFDKCFDKCIVASAGTHGLMIDDDCTILGISSNQASTGKPFIKNQYYRAGFDENDHLILTKKENGKWIPLTEKGELAKALSEGLFKKIIDNEFKVGVKASRRLG